MSKRVDFFRKIEGGIIQGACRYPEYYFAYKNVPSQSDVLELGGGHSVLALTIYQAGNNVWVTELDQRCYMHHHNLGKKYKNYHALKVKDEILPILDGKLDVVISASSIEHFDPDNDGDIKAINEAYRVLKDGGIFIVTIPVHKDYIKNRYAGHPIHPPEKVYNEKEYKKRFLIKFKEEEKMFWKWSSIMPTEYEAKPEWIKRGDIVSTEKAKGFDDASGLCVVLRK